MLGERSDQRGLWEADRLYLDHVGREGGGCAGVGRAQDAGPAGWVAAGRLRDFAVLPGGPGGLVRAGRSVRLYSVAAGACLDQCGVSGIRASPQTLLRDGPMEQRSDELPEEAWREITVAEGSQGPRS